VGHGGTARGLPILRTSVEAFATLTEQKNIELFDHHHIFFSEGNRCPL